VGQRLGLSCCTHLNLFLFYFILKEFLEVWEMGQGFWENGCIASPFLKLAPTLESANSSKIHGEWRFHFFSKKKFLNLAHTWTFISSIGIFVS
jgi:hypothetical protein